MARPFVHRVVVRGEVQDLELREAFAQQRLGVEVLDLRRPARAAG
jgi:hypothetical protein